MHEKRGAPAVSVVIAARNQERYIGRCLRSLLKQSVPDNEFEVIVVNDASTDNTRTALQIFSEDIRIFHNDEQLGLPGSLNIAIRSARGRFVVRVDGDDYVHNEYLNVLAMHLGLNPEIDAAACDYLMVDDHENVIRKVNCFDEPIGCGIMFRIEQLVDLGLYDETFLIHEDEDLRLRFLEKHRIHRVALPLYRYRRHEANMTNDHSSVAAFRQGLAEKHQRRTVKG